MQAKFLKIYKCLISSKKSKISTTKKQVGVGKVSSQVLKRK